MGKQKNHYKDKSFSRGRMSSRNNETIKALEAMGEAVLAAAKEALRKEAEAIAKDAKAIPFGDVNI